MTELRLKRKKFIVKLVFIVAVGVFISEALVMNLINMDLFSDLGSWEPYVDALIVTLLVSPIVYYSINKPLSDELDNLSELKNELKHEVTKRTAELLRAQSIAHIGNWEYSVQSDSMYCSEEMFKIFGIQNKNKTIKRADFIDTVHPDDIEHVRKVLKKATQEGEGFDIQFRIVTHDGEYKYIHSIAKAELNSEGYPVKLVGTVQDITLRKQAEFVLTEALKAKEILISEIHHRVKNNLNIVDSLLNIQARKVEDKEVKEMFEIASGRLRSMALIHESLYRGEDVRSVEFSKYAERLVSQISANYSGVVDGIKVHINVPKTIFSVDTVVPCGLILNELVLNAYKHAFIDGKQGEIVVSLCDTHDGQCILSVKDDGVGLPDGFELEDTSSMGLQIVASLGSQLEGYVEAKSQDGAEFKVIFPHEASA